MPLRVVSCPNCGAPLPPTAKWRTVVCAYCQATVTWSGAQVSAGAYREALAALDREEDGSPRASDLIVAGVPYRLLAPIASGESCEVFLGERARRLKERVIVKRLREGAAQDADLLDAEWAALTLLQASHARGAAYFRTLLPTPVARGGPDATRQVSVFGFASGFVHTLEDVRQAYPQGVDPRHAVWVWRRLLEVLSFMHDSGVVHGAVLPQHLLLHARDHGVKLVGLSCAGAPGESLRAVCTPRAKLYPRLAGVAGADLLSLALDLTMSARAVAYAVGADDGASVPAAVPAPLRELLVEVIASGGTAPCKDAAALSAKVLSRAEQAFGPSRFVKLSMPGW